MSGGVDSSLAAAKCVQAGYETIGVFMKNWSGEDYGIDEKCPWEKDQEDARKVCRHLNIPFKTYNFEKEYRREVIDYFYSEYRAGRTPNPDIMCNVKIKFGTFWEKAMSEGADLIATGHYAQTRKNTDGSTDLIRAEDSNKDQTYFLYRLNQEQLSTTLFPIGHMTKDRVRKEASDLKIPTAEKNDSQGICFIGKVNLQEFLQKELEPKSGDIIDIDTNKKVGEHIGAWFYTNGQREGLGIGGAPKPYFVCRKDIKTNTLFVAMGKENPALHKSEFRLQDIHWINAAPKPEMELTGITRYRQRPHPCSIRGHKVKFDTPVWLSSKGQSLMLIHKNTVMGGGIIEEQT